MSKERLVILVTHEADLVDFYCDTVVQLKDGRVVDVRSNENAGGYVARNKNDIFLGELDEHVQKDSNAEITYFGDAPETPVKLTVVNHNGRFYLKIDTPKVTVLDETSEVNLREACIRTLRRGADRKRTSTCPNCLRRRERNTENYSTSVPRYAAGTGKTLRI